MEGLRNFLKLRDIESEKISSLALTVTTLLVAQVLEWKLRMALYCALILIHGISANCQSVRKWKKDQEIREPVIIINAVDQKTFRDAWT